MTGPFRSSRPCASIMPRPPCDASQRFATYGPIVPLDEPGIPFVGKLLIVALPLLALASAWLVLP